MKTNRIKLTYENENKFNALLKSLKHYCIPAYKDFIFISFPSIRSGKAVGEKLGKGNYKVYLKADSLFEFVHGKIYVRYNIKGGVVTLIGIDPEDFLNRGRKMVPSVYRGCPVFSAKDRFMVDYYYTRNKNI